MLQSIKRRLLPGRRRRERPIVTGDLELFGLSEIIQFLSMGKKTAMVALSRGHHQGRIWFFEGRATHAATDTAEGQAAFFETVCWNTGSFVIDYGVTSDRVTLHDDTMYLFMEGLRRIDESRSSIGQEPESGTDGVLSDEAIATAIDPAEPWDTADVVYPDDSGEQPLAGQGPLLAAEEYGEPVEEFVDEPYGDDAQTSAPPVESAERAFEEELYEAPDGTVEVSSEMHAELMETMIGESDTLPTPAHAAGASVRLSREMSSELDEAMAEVDQLMELDAQGFVVVDPDQLPSQAHAAASTDDPENPADAGQDLPAEVLALHQALDDI